MKPIIIFLFLLFCFPLLSQDNFVSQQTEIPKDIPSAPAFSLLGVNPEFISKPSDIKSFKVDWRIKNYQIAPDLALEGQPLWWLFYKNRSIEDFHHSSAMNKILATTSLSFGTAKLDGINHMAYALKWNIYKEKNQIAIDSLANQIIHSNKLYEQEINQQIDSLNRILNQKNTKTRSEILSIVGALKKQQRENKKRSLQEYKERAQTLNYNRWNADFIELALGKVYTYNNGGLDSLKINSAGFGIWLNAGKTVGKNALASAMLRVNKIGTNTDLYLGGSFRYGSQRYNFFTELIYLKKGNHIDNGFSEEEFFEENYSEDLGVGWIEFADGNSQTEITLSYGGEFKLRKNILLNFALKNRMDGNLKFNKLIPTANVICLME